jgi:hypothetical protein
LVEPFCVVADGDAVYARFHVASGLIRLPYRDGEGFQDRDTRTARSRA